MNNEATIENCTRMLSMSCYQHVCGLDDAYDVAKYWAATGLGAAAQSWWDAGVVDADEALDLHNAGVCPKALARIAHLGAAHCNGDLSTASVVAALAAASEGKTVAVYSLCCPSVLIIDGKEQSWI